MKIIATIGCSISAITCFVAGWKLCESEHWPWIVFVLLGVMSLILSVAVALSPEDKKTFDI